MESKLKRKDEVLAIVVEEMVRLKKELGKADRDLGGLRHSQRSGVDFVHHWSELAELPGAPVLGMDRAFPAQVRALAATLWQGQ